MCHYREKLEYFNLNKEIRTLYSDWNSNTDIVTIWNDKGKVIYSGKDDEAKALSILLSSKSCTKIDEIPYLKD